MVLALVGVVVTAALVAVSEWYGLGGWVVRFGRLGDSRRPGACAQ